jgi:hypothetical protein
MSPTKRIPDPPRYNLRELPMIQRRANAIWGLFDTFAQEFVEGEGPYMWRPGLAALTRYNNAYWQIRQDANATSAQPPHTTTAV